MANISSTPFWKFGRSRLKIGTDFDTLFIKRSFLIKLYIYTFVVGYQYNFGTYRDPNTKRGQKSTKKL